MNSSQLEREIGKMVRAMMTRNRAIGKDLIGYLKTQLPRLSFADTRVLG